MAEANNGNKPDQAPIQNELTAQHDGHAPAEAQGEKRGMEDWEMVENMSETDGNIAIWFRTVLVSVALGIAVFALLAYGVYYFLMHYGAHFFTTTS